MKTPDLPDVSIGEAGSLPAPAKDIEDDEEREETEPTPEDVKEILGFDPDDEEVPE
jgi:hypothetical protein